jgi:hypothetical protein
VYNPAGIMLVNLRALFARLIEIVLLRAGPETLPASNSLLAIVVAVNVAITAIVTVLTPTAPESWLSQLFVSTLVPLLLFQAAFALAKKPERYTQTMIAFFGVNMLFQPAVIPMVATLMPYLEQKDPTVVPPVALSLLAAGIAIWLLTVWVRIVRAAFEWPYFAAVLFIFGQNIAAAFIYAMLFGVPPEPV